MRRNHKSINYSGSTTLFTTPVFAPRRVIYIRNSFEKKEDGTIMVYINDAKFLFSGHEPIYFIENKEKTLRASYDRGTQIFDYME
jgi:hypothetical protein